MSAIRTIIRTRFALTSRAAATRLIKSERDRTLSFCRELGEEGCRKAATVPALLGVDEDMRNWSAFQILEHNNIVNRRITAQILLVAKNGPELNPDFDTKRDVMPSPEPGPEQIGEFESSIHDHLRLVAEIPKLRGTVEAMHPLFGSFDAHKWHCMFGFHLQLHRKQAEALTKLVG